ncbi:MAG: hypothetical protein E3J71_07270 [Candidatus Stahlbacteria bacterium]|nr:MAG: hypothetical protein E3J71_07270 [Candidatus Stahlbacteria bacterium]
MKKALLAVMAVALVIGFAGCEIFKPGVAYFRVKEGAIATYETTVIKHDSTLVEDVWTVTDDTTITKTDTECVGETELDDGTVLWEFKNVMEDTTTYLYMAFDKDNEKADFYNDKADTEPAYSIPYALDSWTQSLDTANVITYEAETTEDVTIGEETYKDADKIKVTYPEDAGYVGAYDWWDKDYGKIKSWFKTEMVVEGSLYLTIDVTTVLTHFTR